MKTSGNEGVEARNSEGEGNIEVKVKTSGTGESESMKRRCRGCRTGDRRHIRGTASTGGQDSSYIHFVGSMLVITFTRFNHSPLEFLQF